MQYGSSRSSSPDAHPRATAPRGREPARRRRAHRHGHATLAQALVVGYLGVVGSDVVSWTFGRRVGLQPTGFIARLVGADDIARIARFYQKWGPWAIAIARNFPGMRLPAFFFAGASGISLPRFLLIDGIAACVTVGVFVSLGRIFADDLGRVLAFLDGSGASDR